MSELRGLLKQLVTEILKEELRAASVQDRSTKSGETDPHSALSASGAERGIVIDGLLSERVVKRHAAAGATVLLLAPRTPVTPRARETLRALGLKLKLLDER
ncbi:hypothetical protein [Ruegeria sp. Ofav3-42]|uniref:hypothetical protein n=1 Tax=Ruegeria sp. Ofav3-42 TaxID=2917759 RepID=UPI001EF474BD|nr:hypothetical protein [Ruegeria sp. Ofav3-42]MCG7521947.1 hypothetical protein [Ruegeria sp. Ofav3-42]